jgi:hypothetical protein
MYKRFVSISGFGGLGKGMDLRFHLTSQVVGETVSKKSSNIDLVNYNFVCCNLDAFGQKVASHPGVVINPLSSWVKTSKWFQGMSTLPTSFWLNIVCWKMRTNLKPLLCIRSRVMSTK